MPTDDLEAAVAAVPGVAASLCGDAGAAMAGALLSSGARKVMAFTGRRSADASGAWRSIADAFPSGQATLRRFDGIEPEPSVETVRRMRDILRAEAPDCVWAVGGGSVLDAAKAATLSWQSGMDVTELFGNGRFSTARPDAAPLRVWAAPLTAGSGSEATPYACVTDTRLRLKMLIADKAVLPSRAFLCPLFTASAPPSLALAAGLDALTHAVEGFLNIHAPDATGADARARMAIALATANLAGATSDGRRAESRRCLCVAACLAGSVIAAKPTSLPHLLSYSWAGVMPHGVAVATTLPYAWAYYLASPPVRAATLALADFFAPGADSPEAVVRGFQAFTASLGAPRRLSDIPGVDPALLDRTASDAGRNAMKLASAPRPVPLAEAEPVLRRILADAWGGTLSFPRPDAP